MKEFQNITTKEIQTVGVKSLPDRPNAHSRYGSGAMTAPQLKAAFDALAELIAERVNGLFESLKDGSFTEAVRLPETVRDSLGDITVSKFLEYFESGYISEKMMVKSTLGTESLYDTLDTLRRYLEGKQDKLIASISLSAEGESGFALELYNYDKRKIGQLQFKIAKGNLDDNVTEYIQGLIDSNYEDTVQPKINEKYSELNIAIGAETNARINDIAEVKNYTVDKLDYDPNTGVLSIIPLEGEARTIDLPLELIVESGEYDAENNKIVLKLAAPDAAPIEIPVDDLIREVISMPTAAAADVGKVAVVTGENKYELRIPTCEFATEGLTYQYADGSYSVVACEQSVGGKIVIPTQIGEIPVREIKAIAKNANVTEIVVPDSVVSIGTYAFMQNTGLEKVILSKKLSSISLGLFYSCSNLKDVYIRYDEGVASLAGTVAFGGCTATIHVPKQFLDAYKGATNWAEIADKIVGYETLESLRADVDAAVSQHVTDEESREAAEKRLEDQIATEAETREENDDNLSYQIEELRQAFESTTQALTQTDTEHYNHLVSLFDAIGNLQSVDTQLGTAISNEETKRTTADTDLSNRITNTQAYAEAVNGNLVAVQQNLVAIIQQEQTARANKDTNLQSQITTLAQGQEGLQDRDDDLQLQIDTINAKLNSFINVAEVGA